MIKNDFQATGATDPSYYDWIGSFEVILNTGDQLWAEFKNTKFSGGIATTQQWDASWQDLATAVRTNWTVTTQTTLKGGLLTTQRGEISQADFLKGIMKMFNAVA